MRAFHVSIHTCPQETQRGNEVLVGDCALQTLSIEPARRATPLDVTFEQARSTLVRLPRMICEPDGSFVWVGGSDDAQPPVVNRPHSRRGWQVEGNLYDQGECLSYVELSGTCDEPALEQLLVAFGWPQACLMFQLLAQAVFLDEAAFRQLLFGR